MAHKERSRIATLEFIQRSENPVRIPERQLEYRSAPVAAARATGKPSVNRGSVEVPRPVDDQACVGISTASATIKVINFAIRLGLSGSRHKPKEDGGQQQTTQGESSWVAHENPFGRQAKLQRAANDGWLTLCARLSQRQFSNSFEGWDTVSSCFVGNFVGETKRPRGALCKPLNLMAGSTGLEPAASAVTASSSLVTN